MNRPLRAFFLLLALFLLGTVLLFPIDCLTSLVEWRIKSICKKEWGARFICDEVRFQNRQFVFHHARIVDLGDIEILVEKASFAPYLDLRKREIGALLSCDKCKVICKKKESFQPLILPSFSIPFFTTKVEVAVSDGEMFLYDYTGTSPFFQYTKFTFTHETGKGDLSHALEFEIDGRSPSVKVDFLKKNENFTLFSTFHEHSLEKLSSLASFFCDSALPSLIKDWKVENGTITGSMHLGLVDRKVMELHADLNIAKVALKQHNQELARIEALKTELSYHEPVGFTGVIELVGNNCFLDKADNISGTIDLQRENIALQGRALGMKCELLCDSASKRLTFEDGSEISLSFDLGSLSGSFHGEKIDLEKFLSPFIFKELPLQLQGLMTIDGTFDRERIACSYEGDNVKLLGSGFTLEVDKLQERGEHSFELSSRKNRGALPLQNARYIQKNRDLIFSGSSAIVRFDGRRVHFEEVETSCEGVEFCGDLTLDIHGSNDIDLLIQTKKVEGSLRNAQKVLAHLIPSSIWDVPLEGMVRSGLTLSYHFNPEPELKEVRVSGLLQGGYSSPIFSLENYAISFDYDRLKNSLQFSEGLGEITFPHSDRKVAFSIPLIQLFSFPQFALDLEVRFDEKIICGHSSSKNGARTFFVHGDNFEFGGSAEIVERGICLKNLKIGDVHLPDDLILSVSPISGLTANIQGVEATLSLTEKLAIQTHATILPQKIWQQLPFEGKVFLDGTVEIENQMPKFIGDVSAKNWKFSNVDVDGFQAQIVYHDGLLQVENAKIEDRAGKIECCKAQLTREGDLSIDTCKLSDFRLSRLKSDVVKKMKKERSPLRSLFIRRMFLDGLHGNIHDPSSFTGYGKVIFDNQAKPNFVDRLLFIPTEINARLGLDFTTLVPAKGKILYKIEDSKIFLTDFIDMYSNNKRSLFYLLDSEPAYIDFNGKMNLQIKMKQYTFLMKLAELFTISVQGTLSNPSYSLI